jgi:hypothetical protein
MIENNEKCKVYHAVQKISPPKISVAFANKIQKLQRSLQIPLHVLASYLLLMQDLFIKTTETRHRRRQHELI